MTNNEFFSRKSIFVKLIENAIPKERKQKVKLMTRQQFEEGIQFKLKSDIVFRYTQPLPNMHGFIERIQELADSAYEAGVCYVSNEGFRFSVMVLNEQVEGYVHFSECTTIESSEIKA